MSVEPLQPSWVDCAGPSSLNKVETSTTAGGSTLTYDATTNRYQCGWKTESTWAGTCRAFDLGPDDGSTHRAMFRLRR